MTNEWNLVEMNMQFYQMVMREAESSLAALNLDVKGFFLLAAVEDCKHPAELAKHCILPRPTVTFLIKKLEAQQYIKRKTVAGDLRKFELVLTKKGADAAKKGSTIVGEVFGLTLDRLSAKERATYIQLLKKMLGNHHSCHPKKQ